MAPPRKKKKGRVGKAMDEGKAVARKAAKSVRKKIAAVINTPYIDPPAAPMGTGVIVTGITPYKEPKAAPADRDSLSSGTQTISEAAILDSLAAIARRVDNLVQHGPSSDPHFENRVRARLDTPGLREWLTERLLS